jgi:hypothetical protein
MNRRGPRPVFFVCVAISDVGELITKTIQAVSQQEAASLFLEQTKLSAKEILGPFRPKRMQVLETTRTLKFTNQIKRAHFNGWEVKAHLLKEPENHAYLVFIKRTDDKKQPAPKGTIIVPISDLRFCDDKGIEQGILAKDERIISG